MKLPDAPDYRYDLFISCAAADLKWVQGFLLPALGLPAERVICNQQGSVWRRILSGRCDHS